MVTDADDDIELRTYAIDRTINRCRERASIIRAMLDNQARLDELTGENLNEVEAALTVALLALRIENNDILDP